MIPAIIFGSWFFGALLAYVLTPLFPWGTIYADAKDLRRDADQNMVIFTSAMWPLIIALVLPFVGIYHLREWIKNARLKRHPPTRVSIDDEDEEDDEEEDDDWDDEDEDDHLDEDNLDYRTMPCQSCGHAVMKEP